jgi:DNA-binding XRE family transcriptional regulator
MKSKTANRSWGDEAREANTERWESKQNHYCAEMDALNIDLKEGLLRGFRDDNPVRVVKIKHKTGLLAWAVKYEWYRTTDIVYTISFCPFCGICLKSEKGGRTLPGKTRGKELRKKRRALEVSQDDLSVEMGLSQTVLSRIENGKRELRLYEQEKAAKFFSKIERGQRYLFPKKEIDKWIKNLFGLDMEEEG